MLGNRTRGNSGLSRVFLYESQQLGRWLFIQRSSFIMGTHQSFISYGQVTFMLHNRMQGFLTDGILTSEVVSKFSFYLRVMKTKLSPNILKGVLAPFGLPLYLRPWIKMMILYLQRFRRAHHHMPYH